MRAWWCRRNQCLENGCLCETAQTLQAMGHALKLPGDVAAGGRGSSHVWGNMQSVAWDKRTNTLSAASDPRNPVGAGVVSLAQPVP